MLWSLLVSGYVIYLYRKLNAEGQIETAPSSDAGGGRSTIEAELAKLNERIESLENRASVGGTRERSS